MSAENKFFFNSKAIRFFAAQLKTFHVPENPEHFSYV